MRYTPLVYEPLTGALLNPNALTANPAMDISVCSIVHSELFYAAKSQTPERTLEKQTLFLTPYATVPFDEVAAAIRATLERQGAHRSAQIAAIAIARSLRYP